MSQPAVSDLQNSPLQISPLTGAMGAELSGVDLGKPLSDELVSGIRQALVTYGAIFFRDQHLTNEQHLAFARRFGVLEEHPIVDGMDTHPEIIRMHKPAGESASFGVGWHSDNSFLPQPSLGSIVRAETVPPYGGDTLFANQAAAYHALSPGMKRLLEGLVAVHSAREAYTSDTAVDKYDGDTAITYRRTDVITNVVEHPVVRTHPETGQKALYINPMFTLHFKDMSAVESTGLLETLFQHATRGEFQCRFRWQPGSVAFWDNRLVMHNALDDYQDFDRTLYRVTVAGDTPV
ncbi:MAG: TauD/TfdA dioxygenase family protein [Alphaproteobacteria bacterium]